MSHGSINRLYRKYNLAATVDDVMAKESVEMQELNAVQGTEKKLLLQDKFLMHEFSTLLCC
jgi:hypothetical protein